MATKVGLISLGCAKNLVDSEIMLGHLRSAGMDLTSDSFIVITFTSDSSSSSSSAFTLVCACSLVCLFARLLLFAHLFD